jgi:CubicO group peptidase (beta-lactamase class C family)
MSLIRSPQNRPGDLVRSNIAMITLSAAILLTSASPARLAAEESADKVDKLFASWDRTTSPGAALAVIKDGRIVYGRGYGMAQLEDGLVNTPDRVFDIGSVSKQFTAACAAFLVREGKIGLDDDIRKYLPEMPAYEKPVTVRHLLHHTSGLRDYNALLSLAGFRPESDCPTVEEAAEIIRRQKKLNYAPGEEYSYTNSGFFLLSQIVERVSGRTLNAFAQERIFKPLGMTKTLFQDDHTQIIKDRATGYSADGGVFKISLSNWDATGDGNVYTTVRDLALWDQAFYSGAALGLDLVEMMQQTGVLNSGQPIDYAWGLVVGKYKGLKVVEHGGAWVGFRAALVRFPEQRFSVIILANLDTIDPSGLAFRVADIYLADALKEAPQEGASKEDPATGSEITLPQAEIEALLGNWQDARFGLWLTVMQKEKKLFSGLNGRSFPLTAVAKGKFVVKGNAAGIVLEFTPAEKGRAAAARMTIGQRQDYRFIKAAPLPAIGAPDPAKYAGSYVSEELLGARYVIRLDKGQLVLKTRDTPRAELKAMAPDKFTVPGFGLNVEFTRGRGGQVAGFTVSVGRTAGIGFVKE